MEPISVVVCNYQGALHLPHCLGALRAQTHAPAELIVVDNASTDASEALVRERFPEARWIGLQRNAGPAPARNRPRILATIDHLRASRPVVVLRSRGEVSQFVAGLPRTLTRATAGDRWDPIKTIATE